MDARHLHRLRFRRQGGAVPRGRRTEPAEHLRPHEARRRGGPARRVAAVVLRLPLLFGPIVDWSESAVTSLVPAIVASARPGADAVGMDAWAIRYPTFTPDVADVIRDLTLRHLAGASITGLRHWSGEEPMTKYDIAQRIAAALGIDAALKRIDQPTDATPRPYDCHLDASSVRAADRSRDAVRYRAARRAARCAAGAVGSGARAARAHARCAGRAMNAVRDIAEDVHAWRRGDIVFRESAGVRRNRDPQATSGPHLLVVIEDHSMAKPIIKTDRRATECVPGFPAWTRSMHFDHATIVTDDIDGTRRFSMRSSVSIPGLDRRSRWMATGCTSIAAR